MTSAANWIAGARPRTLPAAIAPVVVGSAVAYWDGGFRPYRAALALAVSLFLQVGVNYANDYSDGVRGTDQERVGPVRLVGQGLAPATAVKLAAFAAFGAAAIAGLLLTWISGHWWFIAVGALAIVSAWGYTGGANPYGYLGLGELFVFVWFGLAAVLGTEYAQSGRVSAPGIVLAMAAGALACALLVVNNLRDREGDAIVGKHTLAVKLGDFRTRSLYFALVAIGPAASLGIAAASFGLSSINWPLGAGVGVLAALWARPAIKQVAAGAIGRDLIAVLGATGRVQIAWSLLTAVGIVLFK